MKCPKCGNDQWYANQRQYWTIKVNDDNEWQEDIGSYDSEKPYGPFTCTECGHEEDKI